MSKLYTYTYSVLRYVHDVTTGEFLNVGVALYCPEARYASAQCRTTYARLSHVFPGINAEHFKSLMRHIQSRFEEHGQRLATELPFESPLSVVQIAESILPRDDSSLQWAAVGSGRARDPSQTLEELFERMVMRYDDRQAPSVRSDEEVWRHFKRDLEAKRVLQHLRPKKISVKDDEIEFQYSWKNGKWHCLEPISFDLAGADSIKDKAHRWLGQLASIYGADDAFKVYLLVGAPKDEKLQAAYKRAISILGKIPSECEIISERDAGKLASRIAKDVDEHNAKQQ